MRKFVIYCMVLLPFFLSKAQTKLIFNYDEAGNQVKRTFCTNCKSSNNSLVKSDNQEQLLLKDNLAEAEAKIFTYYPNPTKDIVNIKLIDKQKVYSVSVYSTNGSLIETILIKETNQFSFNLSYQPKGIYVLVFNLTDGTKFSKKIIKI